MSGVPVGGEELREALAETLDFTIGMLSDGWDGDVTALADALLAGPLAQVVAERDAAVAAVERAKQFAYELECGDGDDWVLGGRLRDFLDPQPADAPSAPLSGPLTDERAGGDR